MSKQNAFHKDSGNAIVIVLVVLVVAAVGGLAYLSGQMLNKNKGSEQQQMAASAQPASGQAQAAQVNAQAVQPGNPVVAKVDSQEITRGDVFSFIQQLPQETRKQPVQQLFPLAQEQVITARIVEAKSKKVNLDNDPEVKKRLDAAKEQIVRAVFINKEVEKKLTEERVKTTYEQYVKTFPEIDEVKARHILVETEKKAKDIVSQLNDGGAFETLAAEHSTDPTGKNGGELGFFAKNDNLVPEFVEAAFALQPGEYSKTPVKTEFGFHVIKIDEARKRPPADFETAKPFLESELRRVVLNEVIQEWREQAEIERFDINGAAIEPAAGGDAPAEAAQ